MLFPILVRPIVNKGPPPPLDGITKIFMCIGGTSGFIYSRYEPNPSLSLSIAGTIVEFGLSLFH